MYWWGEVKIMQLPGMMSSANLSHMGTEAALWSDVILSRAILATLPLNLSWRLTL